MRGQAPLIAMRREGYKPGAVFIDTDAGPNALPRWAQWQNVDSSLCDLDIEASENLLRVDWRPLIGLLVFVSGSNAERIRAVAKAVHEAGALRVVASCVKRIGIDDEFVAFQTLWIEDTEEEACGTDAA